MPLVPGGPPVSSFPEFVERNQAEEAAKAKGRELKKAIQAAEKFPTSAEMWNRPNNRLTPPFPGVEIETVEPDEQS